jgi:hypothetical protein
LSDFNSEQWTTEQPAARPGQKPRFLKAATPLSEKGPQATFSHNKGPQATFPHNV